MSKSNGIIRIGKKGLKKFAFGEEGSPGGEVFEIDVVATIQEWFNIHAEFVELGEEDEDGTKSIPNAEIPRYQQAAVEYVERLRATTNKEGNYPPVTVAEAFDFIARLRECHEELVSFFRPKLQKEQDSQDTSEVELRFSEEVQTQTQN